MELEISKIIHKLFARYGVGTMEKPIVQSIVHGWPLKFQAANKSPT
jgi:hypothetical protein